MTTSPIVPQVVRGAIVVVDLFDPIASAIVFQYNPDTVTRTLHAQTAGDGGARAEVLRLKGAPIETIKLDAEIDATDQLESGEPLAKAAGIYPQLSALEMLLYTLKFTKAGIYGYVCELHTEMKMGGTVVVLPARM